MTLAGPRSSRDIINHYKMTTITIRIAGLLCLFGILSGLPVSGQGRSSSSAIGRLAEEDRLENRPESLEWLKDAGFGMFVHWSLDSQIGSVISHVLVGASGEFVNYFYDDLPKTFNPKRFDPEEWVVLAKLAGMKYIVLTAKHHSGFCLWDTKTTGFNVMNTPFGRDIVAEYVEACRKHGLKVGLYFSPPDFLYMHKHGNIISRETREYNPSSSMEYHEYIKAQVAELMKNYGKIDVVFFDGGATDELKKLCWAANPDLLITRGAIRTPEMAVAGTISNQAWESCITMGSQWQYRVNENYKTGTRLIEILIETRAKGGSLLLNVGPKPNGELPGEQEERLREMALWYSFNKDAVDEVRPWIVANEGDIWFSRKGRDVYAYLTKVGVWERGTRKSFVLGSVKATKDTEVLVVGQSGLTIAGREMNKDIKGRASQEEDGLHISVVQAYRPYSNNKWANPVVVKVTNVEPALVPPVFATLGAEGIAGSRARLRGELTDIAGAGSVEAGFQYRIMPEYGEEVNVEEWIQSDFVRLTANGEFRLDVGGLKSGPAYQVRAVIKHRLVTLYGDTRRFSARAE